MAKAKTIAALARLIEDDLGLPFDVPEPPPPAPDAPKASPAQVQEWAREFLQNLKTLKRVRDATESTVGTLAHSLGTLARQLRAHSAWIVVGSESWEKFCDEYLGLSERHVRRLEQFARDVTDELSAFGIRKCLAGLALAKKLKLRRLHELDVGPDATEPAAWAAVLGEPVSFASSTATRLERLVAGPKALKAKPVKPSAKVADLVVRRRTTIARVTERHPALEKLEPRSFTYKGRPQIRHKPASTDDDLAALAALYAALVKVS